MVTLTSPTSTTLVAEWLVRTSHPPTHTHTSHPTLSQCHIALLPLQPPVDSNATTSPPEAWFVSLRDSNNSDLRTFIVSELTTLTYAFTQLDKGSEYTVRVAGNNSRGIGGFSDFVSSQTLVDREYYCSDGILLFSLPPPQLLQCPLT